MKSFFLMKIKDNKKDNKKVERNISNKVLNEDKKITQIKSKKTVAVEDNKKVKEQINLKKKFKIYVYFYNFFEKLRPIFFKKFLNTLFLKHGKKHLTEKILRQILSILNLKVNQNIYLKYTLIPKQKYWNMLIPKQHPNIYMEESFNGKLQYLTLKEKKKSKYNLLKCNLKIDITSIMHTIFKGEYYFLINNFLVNIYRKFVEKAPVFSKTEYLNKYTFIFKKTIFKLLLI